MSKKIFVKKIFCQKKIFGKKKKKLKKIFGKKKLKKNFWIKKNLVFKKKKINFFSKLLNFKNKLSQTLISQNKAFKFKFEVVLKKSRKKIIKKKS